MQLNKINLARLNEIIQIEAQSTHPKKDLPTAWFELALDFSVLVLPGRGFKFLASPRLIDFGAKLKCVTPDRKRL